MLLVLPVWPGTFCRCLNLPACWSLCRRTGAALPVIPSRYRVSKAALNMLARCIYMDLSQGEHTVLSIHPGWAATEMGTLDGAVEAEIDVKTSVNGMVDVIELHRNDKNICSSTLRTTPGPGEKCRSEPAISLAISFKRPLLALSGPSTLSVSALCQ